MVDLITCVQMLGNVSSSPRCLPQVGRSEFFSKPKQFGGEYEFLFLSKINQEQFEAAPEVYAPKAGGFCALTATGLDPGGEGLWCSCPSQEEGYAVVDGSLYFFVSALAKRLFLEQLTEAVKRMPDIWAKIIMENKAKQFQCFNTKRLIPVSPHHASSSLAAKSSTCDERECLVYYNCEDCSSGSHWT